MSSPLFADEYVVNTDRPEEHGPVLVFKLSECRVNKKDYIAYQIVCPFISPNDFKDELYSAKQLSLTSVEVQVPAFPHQVLSEKTTYIDLVDSGDHGDRKTREYNMFFAAVTADPNRRTKKIKLTFPEAISAEAETQTKKEALEYSFELKKDLNNNAAILIEWIVYVSTSGELAENDKKTISAADQLTAKMQSMGLGTA